MLDPLRLVAPSRPLGGASIPKNKQKVRNGKSLRSRDVKNDDRPDYVYENKGNHDKMSTAIAGILHKFGTCCRKLHIGKDNLPGNRGFVGCKPSPCNQSAP
jgi:hypothetical protein